MRWKGSRKRTAGCSAMAGPLGRRWPGRRGGLEKEFIFRPLHWDLVTDQGLDSGQAKDILFVGQGDGFPRGPCSGSPTYPMDVVFGILWHIVVDHMSHPFDMETSGGNICRHQNREFPSFEGFDHFESYSLIDIAGDGPALVAVEGKSVGEPLGTPLRVGEDQNPFSPLPLQ